MSFKTFFLLALAFTASPAINAAPTRVRADSSDFLMQNGLDAQKLNAQFASLTASDSCNDGDQACVQGGFAQCVSGKWAITTCSAGLSCFVLPLVNKAGTSIGCDTQADALGRITATGATGGITGDGSNSTASSSVPAAQPSSSTLPSPVPSSLLPSTISASNPNPSSTPDDCEDDDGTGDTTDDGEDCTDSDQPQPSASPSGAVNAVSDSNDMPCSMTDSSESSSSTIIDLNRRAIIFFTGEPTPLSSTLVAPSPSSSSPPAISSPLSTPFKGSSISRLLPSSFSSSEPPAATSLPVFVPPVSDSPASSGLPESSFVPFGFSSSVSSPNSPSSSPLVGASSVISSSPAPTVPASSVPARGSVSGGTVTVISTVFVTMTLPANGPSGIPSGTVVSSGVVPSGTPVVSAASGFTSSQLPPVSSTGGLPSGTVVPSSPIVSSTSVSSSLSSVFGSDSNGVIGSSSSSPLPSSSFIGLNSSPVPASSSILSQSSGVGSGSSLISSSVNGENTLFSIAAGPNPTTTPGGIQFLTSSGASPSGL